MNTCSGPGLKTHIRVHKKWKKYCNFILFTLKNVPDNQKYFGFTVLTPQLLRLLQVRNESKQNPIYGSHFYSAYEKYYKNNRNTK